MTKRPDEEGSTLVEFAIGASVLFLTLFGIISMSLALYSYNFVAQAARDAARYAIVRGTSCVGFSDCDITSAEVNTYVKGLNYPGIISGNLTASLSPSPAGGPGSTITVTVLYTFPMDIPFWPHSGTTIHMGSTSSMVVSQ